ncbi:MAG: type ISP restriction/modification enzyme, partial [Ignavibacteriaceae bacterium]
GITHRQMRKHLLETFDEIYVLNLHGSTKKKETTPDGSKDENVFDIQQGVAISIMIKKNIGNKTQTSEVSKTSEVLQSPKKNLGIVKFAELYGKRTKKFSELNANTLNTIPWQTLNLNEPNYFFSPKTFNNNIEYFKNFPVANLFQIQACGIVSARDKLLVNFSTIEAQKIMDDIVELKENKFKLEYKLPKDSRDWTYEEAKKDMKYATLETIDYRPFDKRIIPYSAHSKGVIEYPRYDIMKHMINQNNLALIICKQLSTFDFQHIFVTKNITDKCTLSSQTKEAGYHFPLYLYSEDGTKVPNLKTEIVQEIETVVGKTEPEEILDYIYAVLHSPTYREKYKEFLKIDFPRVPYPKDKKTFKALAALGTELRLMHLLESPKVNQFVTTFPVMEGDEEVEKIKYENGKVWINKLQYFGNVPETAWNFYIGGYQPAQKWLKDRRGRELTNQEIEHYQKIIVALMETDRIMKEIDKVNFF